MGGEEGLLKSPLRLKPGPLVEERTFFFSGGGKG